ncbi:MAG: hypothetical protein IPG45_30730 [Deltaproteobacteria bacterium]|nr:hypothetical protein [Deltaproteobacteria bacterium]
MRRVLFCLPLFAACVPSGREVGARLGPRDASSNTPDSGIVAIPVDGGFDDAGNPIDGGFIIPDSGVLNPPDASVVNVVYDQCPDNPHNLDAPIIVNDGSNTIAREPGFTSFLVPLAIGAEIYSLNSLTVDDGTQRLPAQFEALGRWDGHKDDCTKPIRYAYAHVRAVPGPGANVIWHVRSDANNQGEPTTMNVNESASEWQIDTGVARFTVPRGRFRGITKVELPNGSGFDVISELPANESAFQIDHNGNKSTGNLDPWYFVLERRGPQTVTVAARGFYAAAGGGRDLGYTIRLHFYASSSVVRVEHTYYYGEVAGWGADGLTNTTNVGRAWMRVPLAGASGVIARADTQVHTLGLADLLLEQVKRTPSASAVRFTLNSGGSSVESGTWADHPFVAITGPNGYAMGTIARLSHRDPQGLRVAGNELQLDFTSSPIGVGGARGIWSIGAIDFGRGAPNAARADALQLHAERPLLGTPQPAYLNTTQTIGPYATSEARFPGFFAEMLNLHQRSRDYLRDLRVTGIQIWPDLPRNSCYQDFNCDQQRNQLYEGGDNNYWNWSKPGVDEFFRTGDNNFLYDFSLGEAYTYVETLAVRTDHDRISDSSVAGLAPCYGDSRGYDGDFREGLNNRRDRCVADYSYSKTIRVAALATGDPRFVDFYEEAAESVINAFGAPPDSPEQFLEVTLNRLSEQRLEVLTAGAELARDPTTSTRLRQRLRNYVDFMLGRVLINGHSCDVGGSGSNDAKALGNCGSSQAWMMPVGVEWATRASRFLRHPVLANWVVQHGATSARNHTVIGGNGLPDFSQADNGWRTTYQCSANGSGVVDASCAKINGGENDGRFYANGVLSYLNVFGIVLAADPSDPIRICQWLPAAYNAQVGSLPDLDVNYHIWGKASGQAFGMSAEAVGALSACP